MAATSHTQTLIEETPSGLRVLMPVPRMGCVIAFLGVWLFGWAAGEISALRALLGLLVEREGGLTGFGGALFLLIWLVGWTAGGAVAGFIFLMMLDGREILTVDDTIIRRRAEAFRWGLSWRYPLEKCSNLRPTGNGGDVKNFISFDYTGPKSEKTVRLGSGLTETAAEEVAEKIWARFPSLMPDQERRRREHEAVAAAGNFVTDEVADAGAAAPPATPPVQPPLR
jgi:hypothetical protein